MAPKLKPFVLIGTKKHEIPYFSSLFPMLFSVFLIFVLHIIRYKLDIPAPLINDLLPLIIYSSVLLSYVAVVERDDASDPLPEIFIEKIVKIK